MQQSIKTLVLTLATLGLASCGGGGGDGGSFGSVEDAKARTHVCPTLVLTQTTPFFKPGSSKKYASGAEVMFSHEGGLAGAGAFADAGDVIGVALTLHPGSDAISASRESSIGANEDINFKRFLVARFRDNDFNANTLDIGNLAYVYLATPQEGSDTSTPVLLPENQATGAPEIAANKTLVAYKEGADFRYKTTESSSPGPFISGKDYLKQRLEEEAVASGASPDQMYDRVFNKQNTAATIQQPSADDVPSPLLGYTEAARDNMHSEAERRKDTATACLANAADLFEGQLGSSRATFKDQLAVMETAMGAQGRSDIPIFSSLARDRIRQSAYEHLCPESNRFSTYVDDRINSADWSIMYTERTKEERYCIWGPFIGMFYSQDAFGSVWGGRSIRSEIEDNVNSTYSSEWGSTKNACEYIWTKIHFDQNCGSNSRNNDYSHHSDWYDAASSGSTTDAKRLLRTDVADHPQMSELRWVTTGTDGYLKGCFNGSEDWPATRNQNATAATLRSAILEEARAQGETCADSDATVATFKADMTSYIDAMSENPSRAAAGPDVITLSDHMISGTNELGEATFVFPFSKALACVTKNSKSMSEPDACPISREEAMADLQSLVRSTGVTSPGSGSMVLTPLYSGSRVAEVLESAYRTTDTFISSVNEGILNLSSSATGRAIGDACMQHIIPLIDWASNSVSSSPSELKSMTKLDLQDSGIGKDTFIALVEALSEAKQRYPSSFSIQQVDATNLGISLDSTTGKIRFADGSGLTSTQEAMFDDLFGYAIDGKVILLVDGGQVATEVEDIEMVLPEPE